MSPLDPSKPASKPRATRTPRPLAEPRPPAPAPETSEAAGIPPVLTAAPTVGALLAALRRRWLLAVCVALLGGILAAAALMVLVPGRYISEVRLQLRRSPDYMPGGNDNV